MKNDEYKNLTDRLSKVEKDVKLLYSVFQMDFEASENRSGLKFIYYAVITIAVVALLVKVFIL